MYDQQVRAAILFAAREGRRGLLERLLEHVLNSPSGRAVVARSPELPIDALALLAKDREDGVRRAVAGNPATPPRLLRDLADDWPCRLAVACNSGTPAPLLNRLARDWNGEVRRAVARNPSTPGRTLRRLADDADERVRHHAASNPRSPHDARAPLAGGAEARRGRATPGDPAEAGQRRRLPGEDTLPPRAGTAREPNPAALSRQGTARRRRDPPQHDGGLTHRPATRGEPT